MVTMRGHTKTLKLTRSTRRDAAERRARRRDELLDAAIRAIRMDGADVSMTRMAREAGVSKPILYRHFGDRGGVHQAIAERYLGALTRALTAALEQDAPARDLLVATLDAYLSVLEDDTEVYRFLARRATREHEEAEEALTSFREQVAERISAVLRDRLAPAGGALGAADAWAHALVGGATAAGEWWIDRRPMSRRALVEYLTALMWGGFAGVRSEPQTVRRSKTSTRRSAR